MSLRFSNSTGSTVWVMICFYEAACHQPGVSHGGIVYLEPYQKMGWYAIHTPAPVVVYENDLDDTGPWWYWYAHNNYGNEWAGEYQETVTHEEFNLCADANPAGGFQIGMREFHADGSDKWINLTV